jgi:phosphatidylinositol 4-kinase
MVNLMGGRESVGYRMFTELTVKAFLACRPYGQAVVDTASLMLAAEFPSFKGEPTMERLRDRFKLDLTEQEAAEAMKAIIADADTNFRSRVYDEFQLRQGGIPYAK